MVAMVWGSSGEAADEGEFCIKEGGNANVMIDRNHADPAYRSAKRGVCFGVGYDRLQETLNILFYSAVAMNRNSYVRFSDQQQLPDIYPSGWRLQMWASRLFL
jgi:hypothetical protein